MKKYFNGLIYASETKESIFLFFILALLLWLVNHPYIGLCHDAIIYSLLAARRLTPEGYINDLFFIFGSQDDFSFYTPIFSSLVANVGLDYAARFVVLVGAGLWIAGFMWLGRAIFRDDLPWKFILLLAMLITWSYSPNAQTFQLGESFATPRVWSMPFGLFAIAAELTGRRFTGFVFATLATLLHPLLGIWALILIACYRWNFRLNLALAVSCFSLALLIPIFSPFGSMRIMSHEWLEMVRYSTLDVFFADFYQLRIDRPVYCLLAFAIGVKHGQERLRPMYLTLGLMTISVYLLCLICSHFLPVALVMQTQPWRIMWLAMCLGLFAVTDGLWRLMLQGWSYKLTCAFCALIAYALEPYILWVIVFATTCILSDRVMALVSRGIIWLGSHRIGLVVFTFCLVVLILPRYLVDLEIIGIAVIPSWWESLPQLRGFLLGGGLGLGLICWIVIATLRPLRWLAWGIILPLLVVALWNWDHRNPRQKQLEASFLPVGKSVVPFAGSIHIGDVVAWPDGEMKVWFELKTAVYASSEQVVGIVFSEQKARESFRRLKRMASASAIGNNPEVSEEKALEIFRTRLISEGKDIRNIHKYYATDIRPPGVRYLCTDAILDWVVINASYGKAEIQPQDAYTDAMGVKWDLYACKYFRS